MKHEDILFEAHLLHQLVLTLVAVTVTVVTVGIKPLAMGSLRHFSEDTADANKGSVCPTRVAFITCSRPSTLDLTSPLYSTDSLDRTSRTTSRI